jgi:hypothetical protein
MARRNEQRGVVLGFLLVFGLHFIAFWVIFGIIAALSIIQQQFSLDIPWLTAFLTNYTFIIAFIIPGITQLIYVIPLVIWLRQRQNWGMMKGIIIGAVLTAFLNGTCFLYLAFNR